MEDTFPARPRRTLPARAVILVLGLASTTGCTTYVGTTASSFLRRVRDDPDPNVRYLAYAKLAKPNCYDNDAQKAEAAKLLIAKLAEGREPVATRAVIIQTLGELKNPAAREVVLKMVNDPEPVIRVQACRALGKVGRAEDATVLARVMTTDTLEDCRIAAIESLGILKPKDPRIARVLVSAMQHDDPATRLASVAALRMIMGKDAGVDASAWAKLLPAEAGDAPPPLMAAPSTAPAGGAPTVSTSPAYPPRPEPIQDPRVDSEAKPASLFRMPGVAAPSAVVSPTYPVHNPNLPTPPPAAPR